MRLGLGLGVSMTGGGASALDPTSLALTLFQRDFSGVTWSGTASAGTSGSHNLITGTADPVAGTALNGHGTANFASGKNLKTDVNNTSIFSTSAGSFWILAKANSIPAHGASTFADGNLFSDPFADQDTAWGLTDSGFSGTVYSSGYHDVILSYSTTGAYFLAQYKWDGVNFKGRINGGTRTSTAAGNVLLNAGALWIGDSSGSITFDGTIAEIGAANITLSDSQEDGIKAYINSRYGLSL